MYKLWHGTFSPRDTLEYDFVLPRPVSIMKMQILPDISKGKLPKCWNVLEGKSLGVKISRCSVYRVIQQRTHYRLVASSECQHLTKGTVGSVCQ